MAAALGLELSWKTTSGYSCLCPGTACYAAILDYLFFRGISDATVTRGMAGFGTDHKMHTSRLVDVSDQMLIKIEFIESPERVREVLPKLVEIASHGLIEVHDTTVIRPLPPGEKHVPDMPAAKLESRARMMRIPIGEHDKSNTARVTPEPYSA